VVDLSTGTSTPYDPKIHPTPSSMLKTYDTISKQTKYYLIKGKLCFIKVLATCKSRDSIKYFYEIK